MDGNGGRGRPREHDGLDVDSAGQIYWTTGSARRTAPSWSRARPPIPRRRIATIIERIRELDPEQPVYDARTLDEVLSRSVSQRWLAMALVGSFASMALFLSCVGVYGVMAFGVSRQRREFGIRLALGATRRAVAAAVVNRGLTLAAVGIVIGLVIAAAVTRGMQAFLYGVSGERFRQLRCGDSGGDGGGVARELSPGAIRGIGRSCRDLARRVRPAQLVIGP